MKASSVKLSVVCALLGGVNAFPTFERITNNIIGGERASKGLHFRSSAFLHFFTIPTLMITLSTQQAQPASAMPTEGTPKSFIEVVSSAPYKLSDSPAFKLLPREMQKSTAVKQLQDLRDLQDSRLDQCADRGIYWEQCFFMGESEGVSAVEKVIFGKGEDQSGIDSQFISPVGAFNPPPEKKSIPTW